MLNPNNLKQTFSANQYLQASQDVIFPEKLTTRAQWIIGRNLCLYRVFDISGLPAKQKESALTMQIRRWAPFPTPGFHIVWGNGIAGVWAWDEERVNSSIEEVGVQAISVLPESVYLPRKEDTAAVWLPATEQGFIFQLWVDGFLFIEKWFSKKPDAKRFDLFIRSIELPGSCKLNWQEIQAICHKAADNPVPEKLTTPWGAKNKTWSILQKLPWEQTMLLGAGVLVLCAYVWLITGAIVATRALSEVNDRAKLLEASVEDVLDARATAERLNQQSKQQLLLLDYPQQLMLMADIESVFKPFNLVLKEWDFKGATLEVTTEGKVNTLNVVKKLEELNWITSVSVSALRRNEQNKFTLTLAPSQ